MRLLAKDGWPLAEVRLDQKSRRARWTALNQVSPAFIDALLRQEDRRFRWHPGIDIVSIASALRARILTKATRRGASTISMQLAALLDPALKRPKYGRAWPLKLRQAWAAMAMELTWSKDEILEAYVNLVGFRGEIVGIEEAARALYGKGPAAIEPREARVLARLIRSPKTNATWIDEVAPFQVPTSKPPYEQSAWHFAARLAKMNGPGELKSKVDSILQRDVEQAVRTRMSALSQRNAHDAAVVVMHNDTGEIIAYVGGSVSTSAAPFVDHAAARRQAGSTLKPFLYALAFEDRLLTPASRLEDAPLRVSTLTGVYQPENYDKRFRGWMSVRDALAQSVNIPAVRAIGLTGVEPFVNLLRQLGFSGLRSAGFYGHSLALGSVDVSLLELVDAYRAIANGGLFSRSPSFSNVNSSHSARERVLGTGVAFMISDILSDNGARAAAFGVDNLLVTPFWSAAKTGTSKDMRDNWCIGFSRQFTVGAWVGNSDGTPMWNVTGVDGAARLWADAITSAEFSQVNAFAGAPTPPPEIARSNGDWATVGLEEGLHNAVDADGDETLKPEWQAPLTRDAKEAPVPSSTIVSPLDGTLLAIDPSIPHGQQMLSVELSENLPRGWKVRLNGRQIPIDGRYGAWAPVVGSWQLELVDALEVSRQKLQFKVR